MNWNDITAWFGVFIFCYAVMAVGWIAWLMFGGILKLAWRLVYAAVGIAGLVWRELDLATWDFERHCRRWES